MPKLLIIGDIGLDLIVGPVDVWPETGTEIMVDRSEIRSGFSAANAALAARHLGHDCVLIGAIGDDDGGRGLKGRLHGIDARLFTLPDRATTLTIAVIHGDGERSFLTTRGHLEHLRWEDVMAHVDPAGPGEIALLTGYFLLPSLRPGYARHIALLRSLGYRIAIDTGWPSEGWTPAVRNEVAAWLPLCDILLLNEIEILGLSCLDRVENGLRRIAAGMASDAIVVAKLGDRGAAAVACGALHIGTAPKSAIFDSVGAGDSFNAGFLAALQNGRSIEDGLTAGCVGASTIIAQFPRSAIEPGALAHIVSGEQEVAR